MPNPVWVIDPTTALNRIGKYGPKKQAIEQKFQINNETESFEFTASDFIKYFEVLVSDQSTGGVRLYIANLMGPQNGSGNVDESDVKSKNKLAIVASSTKIKTVEESKEKAPDLENWYYFIFRDRNNKTVMRIVNSNPYDRQRMDRWKKSYLNPGGKREFLAANFHVAETKSIWYSLDIFKTGNTNIPGMIDFIKSNDLAKVIIHLASRSESEEFSNQLDIVFQLINKNSKSYFTRLNSDDILKNVNKLKITDAVIMKILNTYGDTGIPCPPRICN